MMNSVEIKDKKNTLYTRCKEIVDICKAEVRDMTEDEQREFDANKEEIVNLNTELRDLQARLGELDQQMPEKETRNNTSINTEKHMKKNFSLLRALNAQINNRAFDEETLAVLEAGKREFNDSNITTSAAITLPSMESRTIAVTATTAEHDDVIDIDMQSIIMPNYANLVVAQAGAKILTGCKGDVKYPILDNMGTVKWENELDEADDAGQTFSSKTLTPKRISATISISKMLLAQDSIGIENALRADIQKAFEEKIEESIFSDFSGDTKQPAGILYGVSATSVSGWSDVCDFEATLEENNVGGNLVYVASPKAKAALRAMVKGKHNQLVYENGAVDGTPLYSTSNISGSTAIYGNFSNLVIAQYGGYEIITDIYSRSKYGEVVLVINGYVDFALLKEDDIAVADLS